MGRGRKQNSIKELDYNTIFYNSVGSYVQRINNYLSKQIKPDPLSYHIKILGGFAFKSTDYLPEGIPIIRISDFSDEKINLKSVKFYKESESLKKYELKASDIIIALTGGTIAKLGIVQSGLGKVYLNQRVGKFVVLDPSEFNSEYVYWIARSVQTIIKELAWGAAIPNVSPKQIEKLKFSIPDIKTQSGIIKFLNDLKNDSIVIGKHYFNVKTEAEILFMHRRSLHSSNIASELTHQQTLLKKLRQQILQEAIKGKLTKGWRVDNPDIGPANELLKRIQAEKEQLIKVNKIRPQKPLPPISKEEKPFVLPEGWVWCRLGEATYGFQYGTSSKSLESGKTPVLRMGNIQNGEIDWNGLVYSNDEEETAKFNLVSGDILFNRTNSRELVGKTSLYRGEQKSIYAGYLVRFHMAGKISPDYANHVLNSLLHGNWCNEVKTDAIGQSNINATKLSHFRFPLPPIPEQKAIVAKVKNLLALYDQLKIQITSNKTHAKQLMQAVLKEAFSQQDKTVEQVTPNA